MSSTNMFKAIFSLDDQASDRLERIRQKTQQLNSSTTQTVVKLESVGDTLNRLARRAGGDTGTATRLNETSIAMQKMADQGRMTGTSTAMFARQLDQISRYSSPELAKSIQAQSRNLVQLSSSMKIAEEKASSAGARFQFMADVSDKAAIRMRQMSAAAQGAMLGMSAMEGNMIGLAFSMIFLQFSGALKLSLAFAALTAAGMVTHKWVTKFLDTRKDVQQMARSLFIITGSTKSFGVASQQAEHIVETLGIKQDKAKDFTRGLEGAIVELRRRGFEPTDDALRVFTESMALAMTDLKQDTKEATETAMKSVIHFVDIGKRKYGEYELPLEEWRKRSLTALEEVSEAYPDAANSLEAAKIRSIADMAEMEGEFTNIGDSIVGMADRSDDMETRMTEAFSRTGESTRALTKDIRNMLNLLSRRPDQRGLLQQSITGIPSIEEQEREAHRGFQGGFISEEEELNTIRGRYTKGGAGGQVNVNIDMHDNVIDSEDRARQVAGFVSADLLRNIRLGNAVGFNPQIT